VKISTSHLAEICEINPRTSFQFASDQLCSFVPMEAVDDESAQITKFPLRRFDEVAKGYTIFAENDVIVAKITPCMENGKCAVVRNLRNGIGFGSTEFHVLRATTQVLPEWLFYFWRFPQTRKHAEKNMTGTAGQKRVPPSFLERLDIPVPPLREQERIAALLEKADRLRRTRRFARQLSGTFLQSIFLEMFGDPLVNAQNWEVLPVEELLSIPAHIGTMVPAGDSGEQLCVRVGEVGGWYINLAACKRVSLKDRALDRFTLLSGDIVLARAIGSEEHLGKLSLLGKSSSPVVFDSHLMRLRPDESKIVTTYFTTLLHTKQGRALFMRQARRTAVQFNINTEQISQLRIPVPPLPLQQKFADIVRRFERLHAQQREAERQAEHLFQTLLHRAFKEGGL
jgi:type I restriction enzyme S subunit